jgi:hypothetical protein
MTGSRPGQRIVMTRSLSGLPSRVSTSPQAQDGGRMLFINPLPRGFKSSADKDIYSDNSRQKALTTDGVVKSAKDVHRIFQDKGYYDAIKKSDMYTKGHDGNV